MKPNEEHETPEATRSKASDRSRHASEVHGGDAGEGSTGMNDETAKKRTWVEQVEVAGNELVDRVRDLIEDGNARRVVIRDKDGDELLTAPLTFGVVAGGLITVTAPLLAALGALAALVSRVKLEIIREVDEDEGAAPDAAGSATEPEGSSPEGGGPGA